MPSFDEQYLGTPPWDVGHPQKEFVELEEVGEIEGAVLDIGCGTGENTLFLAENGHRAWGVDSSRLAIEKAKKKAERRGVDAVFQVHDALELNSLDVTFDSAIDSGLFHIFTDAERIEFRESLLSVLKPGGTYHMLCFSEHEPSWWGGPRRVTREEIRQTFNDGWQISYVRHAEFETNLHKKGGKAWLASITKL